MLHASTFELLRLWHQARTRGTCTRARYFDFKFHNAHCRRCFYLTFTSPVLSFSLSLSHLSFSLAIHFSPSLSGLSTCIFLIVESRTSQQNGYNVGMKTVTLSRFHIFSRKAHHPVFALSCDIIISFRLPVHDRFYIR